MRIAIFALCLAGPANATPVMAPHLPGLPILGPATPPATACVKPVRCVEET